MRTRAISVVVAMLLISVPNYGQNDTGRQPPSPKITPLVGVWRAQMDNLPYVTLTIVDEGGSLSGAALFYLFRRSAANRPSTATPGAPEPLLNLKFDGKTLVFQISHRRSHPPRTLSDPPVSYRLTLTGPDKAEVVNESEGPGILMVRSDY